MVVLGELSMSDSALSILAEEIKWRSIDRLSCVYWPVHEQEFLKE